MAKEAQYYEISYLVSPLVKEEEAQSVEETMRSLVDSFGAEIDSWDSPRKRPLAYSIQDEKEAYAGAIRFILAPGRAHELGEKIKGEKHIMRTMMLQWKKPAERKPLMHRPPVQKEEQIPTDEIALDKRLEEILGEVPHESQ